MTKQTTIIVIGSLWVYQFVSMDCVVPDQMLHSMLSDLGLHYLTFSLLGVSRLKLVQITVQGYF